MTALHYLFGFKGRIDRAPMWAFVVVTLVWEVAIALVAWIGFGSRYLLGIHIQGTTLLENWPFGDMASLGRGDGAVLAVGAVLILAYAWALLAVCGKRLHDRGKSVWWLLPFVVLPWVLGMLDRVVGAAALEFGDNFGPLGLGRDAADLVGAVLLIWGFLELFVFRGTAGANRFGPDPSAKTNPPKA